MLLLSGRRSVKGWYSGTATDSQDTLKFSLLAGVRSMNEVYSLEKVAEAYERMMSGQSSLPRSTSNRTVSSDLTVGTRTSSVALVKNNAARSL
jgi:hypothetical protein